MKKVKIIRYLFDKQDKKYILNLLREKRMSVSDFCKKNKVSRTMFYDTLNAKCYLTLKLAKIIDNELNTIYSKSMKGERSVAI